MTRFFSISIRAHLLLMAFIVALPAVGVILYSGMTQRREAILAAETETLKLAENIAQEQQALVSSAKQLLSALAQLPAVRDQRRAEVELLLDDVLRINPQYLNIFIADRNGEMWASAVPMKAPFSIRDRRYFINSMTTGKFSSGEYITGRIFGKPTISFGYPVRKAKGDVNGVIAINFDLSHCASLLARSKLPTGTSYALIDHKGVVLSRGIDPAPYVGRQDTPERFKPMQEGPDTFTFIGPGLAGDKRYITYKKLRLDDEPAPYMYVRAGIPVATVLGKANAVLLRNLGLFTPFLLLALFLARLIGKRSIVDRVAMLQAASQRLSAGDLNVRVSQQVQGGELGSLGKSFDAMAAALQRDQCERRLQEEALQTKALVLDNMAEGVSECTRDGLILYTNPAFNQMFGYDEGELAGTHVADLENKTPFDWKGRVESLVKQKKWYGEILNRKKDGTTFVTAARISESSSTGNVVMVQEDITERQMMERMKDEIISAVSHEMRTPLTALLGFNQFLLENRVDETQRQECLAIMYKESRRLNDLISNFLDLQRIKAREAHYSFGPLEVKALLENAAALHAQSTMHRITLSPLPDLAPILGDEACLHQVFNHLLSNAVKFCPDGGEITLGAQEFDDTVVVSVKDEGIGIPLQSLDKIFDRFFRVNNSDSRSTGGTGLGLALTREIIKTHGGHVWAESASGQGSTFYVSLPVAKEAST